MPRIPFGLDRLPGALAPDDPRLPAAEVGAGTLRLNSEPLPPAVLAAAGEGHDGRVAALLAWLEAGCGDYARPLVDFMRSYVGFLETALAARHEELAAALTRFDGLYAPRDWLWSAPRPLPRAWLPTPQGPCKAGVAFWIDGAPLAIGLDPGGRDSAALRAAGIAVLDLGPTALGGDPAAPGARLPAAFHRFREEMALPASPFRRKLPPPTQGASPSPLAGEGRGGGCERRRPGAVRTLHPSPPPQGESGKRPAWVGGACGGTGSREPPCSPGSGGTLPAAVRPAPPGRCPAPRSPPRVGRRCRARRDRTRWQAARRRSRMRPWPCAARPAWPARHAAVGAGRTRASPGAHTTRRTGPGWRQVPRASLRAPLPGNPRRNA